jgi:hypothetical protein
MATTTPNFGWAVPTSTDLVKDGAVAIETLGDAIDASLVDLKGGTSGQVLKKNSNTDMDFVWSADSAGMTNPMTTTGDTIYSSSGSTPARLGIGSTGQVLTVAGGVPSWATPAGGGGKVLQVVSATYSTATTIASTTLTDSGLSASITPSATSSKIYVIAINKIYAYRNTTLSGSKGALLRGSTIIANMSDYTTRSVVAGSSATQNGLSLPVVQMALDSPNTTSSTTYKTQFCAESTADGGAVIAQEAGSIATIILMEIGA